MQPPPLGQLDHRLGAISDAVGRNELSLAIELFYAIAEDGYGPSDLIAELTLCRRRLSAAEVAERKKTRTPDQVETDLTSVGESILYLLAVLRGHEKARIPRGDATPQPLNNGQSRDNSAAAEPTVKQPPPEQAHSDSARSRGVCVSETEYGEGVRAVTPTAGDGSSQQAQTPSGGADGGTPPAEPLNCSFGAHPPAGDYGRPHSVHRSRRRRAILFVLTVLVAAGLGTTEHIHFASGPPGDPDPGQPVVPPPPEPPAPDPPPFVVVRGDGTDRAPFTDLQQAVESLREGDEIEVQSNKRIPVPMISGKVGLTLKAKAGYRPHFVLADRTERKAEQKVAWFKFPRVHVEGCNFQCFPAVTSFFEDCTAPSRLENCRFFGDGVMLIKFTGNHLSILDCLIVLGRADMEYVWDNNVISLRPSARLEVRNCIIIAPHRQLVDLQEAGGQTVTLNNNTMQVDTLMRSLPYNVPEEFKTITFNAYGNLFDFSPVLVFRNEAYKGRISWSGAENLYTGHPYALLLNSRTNPGEAVAETLDKWREYWKSEEKGSRHVRSVGFKFYSLDLSGGAQAIESLKQTARREGWESSGTDWDSIGPGEAYARPVPERDRRPEPDPGGDIVLVRPGKPPRSYSVLQDAANAAMAGDTIELRTDRQFGGVTFVPRNQKRAITLKAAAGYRPVFTGDIVLERNNILAVEGIQFDKGGIKTPGGYLTRLANCSFATGASVDFGPSTDRDNKEKPAEITNCLIRGWLNPILWERGKLIVRNSCFGGYHLNWPLYNASRVEFDRCCISALADEVVIFSSRDELERSKPLAGTKIAIAARRTMLLGTVSLFDRRLAEYLDWEGEQNLYGIGHLAWVNVENQWVVGTAELRHRWENSLEEKSRQIDPLLFDPAQWQLRSDSPDYRPRANGADFGAQVDRVGVTKGK